MQPDTDLHNTHK